MKMRYLALLMVITVIQGCAAFGNSWAKAENREDGSRFIPVELWSGEPWRGKMQIVMTPANFRYGSRGHKLNKGPMQWRHPETRQQLSVYERINETTKGTKRQLFTVNENGTGLAKVFDSRPNRSTRFQSTNAVLFPLGWWKKGERREFVFDEFVDGKRYRRKATVRMRRLSFTYKGVEHAMKYDWILTDDQDNILFHERFIYGPEKSLMYFKNRLK